MGKCEMAEEVGFEPTVDFHLRRFSRPVHSTTLPLLRLVLPKQLVLILKELIYVWGILQIIHRKQRYFLP